MPETTQMAFSLDKSHRVSCPRPKEANSGNMKEKRPIQDKHSQRIQDLAIMNTKRKRMILKTESSNRRRITLLSTAVKLEPSIRK